MVLPKVLVCDPVSGVIGEAVIFSWLMVLSVAHEEECTCLKYRGYVVCCVCAGFHHHWRCFEGCDEYKRVPMMVPSRGHEPSEPTAAGLWCR